MFLSHWQVYIEITYNLQTPFLIEPPTLYILNFKFLIDWQPAFMISYYSMAAVDPVEMQKNL